jgi:hypothetical protein
MRKTEMRRACSTYGERRGAHKALVGKPEGRRPLGRPRHSWEDNIKMDLTVEWGRGARIESIWLRIGTCDRPLFHRVSFSLVLVPVLIY